MKSNSELKNNESVMAANAESSTVNAQQTAESRIAYYAARFAELGQRAQLLPRRSPRRVRETWHRLLLEVRNL